MSEFVRYSSLLEKELHRRKVKVERQTRTRFTTQFGDTFEATTIAPESTIDLVRDKAATKTLLRAAGFLTPDWYVLKNGETPDFRFDSFPVIVKPNQGSLAQGLTVAVDRYSFAEGVRRVYGLHDDALVEKLVKGTKWRIFATSEKHLSNVRYQPLIVTGDGRTKLYDLVRIRDQERRRRARYAGYKAEIAPSNPDWTWLARNGLFMHSVIPNEQVIELSEVVARATGGVSVERGDIPGFDVAAKAVALIPELYWSALDVIESEGEFSVIELNGYSYLRQHLEPEYGIPRPIVQELVDFYIRMRS